MVKLSAIYVFLTALATLTGYWWVPDSSPNAAHQYLSLVHLPPCSSVTQLIVRPDTSTINFWLRFWSGKPKTEEFFTLPTKNHLEIRYDTVSITSPDANKWEFSLTGILFHHKLMPPVATKDLSYQRENWQLLAKRLKDERLRIDFFYLGTDALGRDIFSRLVIGGRISLAVGLLGTLTSLSIGLLAGLASGFWPGLIDRLLTGLMTLIWSLPAIMLAIALSFAMGRGFTTLVVAIGLVLWVDLARVIRGQVRSLRQSELVQAGHVLGFSSWRILIQHVTPQLVPSLLILGCTNFSTALLLEAGLSFLGLGVESPVPSWGVMIQEGYAQLTVPNLQWIAIAPIVVLILQLFSINQVVIHLKHLNPTAG